MSKKFKPMLAVDASLEDIKFPVAVQPKLDGIRCILTKKGAMSRTLKPIPNDFIRSSLSEWPELRGMEGELMSSNNFNTTQSDVMKKSGKPRWFWRCYDYPKHYDLPFEERYNRMLRAMTQVPAGNIMVLARIIVKDLRELDLAYHNCINSGYEGLICRRPDGLYKYGRSTLREQLLLKIKPMRDAEATIIGYEELKRNENDAELDELGYTKRGHSKSGKTDGGTLGAFRCVTEDGVTFKVGSGFSESQRAMFWGAHDDYIGRKLVYKYQPHGTKTAPRSPIFKSILME